MTNYESLKKWSRICYIASTTCLERENSYTYCIVDQKYILARNLHEFAFEMFRAFTERVIREPLPLDFYENV